MFSEQNNLMANCYIGTKLSEWNDLPAWSSNVSIYSEQSGKSLVQFWYIHASHKCPQIGGGFLKNHHSLLQD